MLLVTKRVRVLTADEVDAILGMTDNLGPTLREIYTRTQDIRVIRMCYKYLDSVPGHLYGSVKAALDRRLEALSGNGLAR